MATQTEILSKNGIANSAALVEACARVGLPTYIGAAFAQHESNGQNVYGHDAGGAMRGAGAVTQSNYQTFLSMVRAGHISNGVGPMQITYPGYFKPRTQEVAGLWNPFNNFVFGLKIIKGYVGTNYSDESLNRAGQIYNSGRANGAPDYGKLTVEFCAKWKKLLGGTEPVKPVALPTLKKGSTGAHVLAVQHELNRLFPLYSHLTLDGLFGNATDKVVREFQRRSHLSVDGVVGEHTYAALRKDGAVL